MDPFQLLLRLIPTFSNPTLVELFLHLPVELTLIMVFSLLVTVLTTSLSRTHGEVVGEKRDTLELREPQEIKVSVESTRMPPNQLLSEFT